MVTQMFRKGLLMALLLFPFLSVNAQRLAADIPMDPKVRTGKLSNGMHYFVMENKEPENRCELRLAVNAGSILEDDDQQGLAHFVEHMCFNGSEHFEKNELVDYLESIGTKFGAHLNAYTSFDETVYMLKVPTDDAEIMDKGLLVLQDWANGVTFETEEIEKERGVVIEEWRTRRGANERMSRRYLPVLFYNSRYAERLPIGKKEILETFKPEVLKRFYKDWYRPDLMAVVAVGDFNAEEMEKKIIAKFSQIQKRENPKARKKYSIPYHESTMVAVERDKEANFTSIQLYYKQGNPTELKTYPDYTESLARQLVTSMINSRIDELKQKGDSPFLFSNVSYSNMTHDMASLTAFAAINPDGVNKALDILITEIERARQHGFIASEFERAKKGILKDLEKAYNEREKTDSRGTSMQLVRAFLDEQPWAGPEWNYNQAKKALPEISLDKVNSMIRGWVKADNNTVIITGVEKEGLVFPTKEEVRKKVLDAQNQKLEPYTEEVDDSPLIATAPTAGKVTAEKTLANVGITEWTLSNGAKVILKPTDFKADEIRFTAFSMGGSSRYTDEEFMSADNAGQIIAKGGVGKFDKNTLDKKLTGKDVRMSPYLTDYFEGMRGGCAPADLETMLQLCHLYFTKPRQDSEAFEAFKNEMKAFMAFSASPEGTLRDTVTSAMQNGHFRAQPLTEERINMMNLKQAYMIYLDRFSDASDFTFVFVGNFDPESLKPMVETYLASLPNFDRKESFKDRGTMTKPGKIERTVKKGTEPKSIVQMSFFGKADYSPEKEFKMMAMIDVLKILLRESMREDQGGVYSVSAFGFGYRIPVDGYQITVGFGCAPENVDGLVKTVMEKVKDLKKNGASDKNLNKVKEIHRRQHETDLENNRWWLRQIERFSKYGLTLDHITKESHDKMVDGISSKEIKKAANTYLNTDNMMKAVLVPESE